MVDFKAIALILILSATSPLIGQSQDFDVHSFAEDPFVGDVYVPGLKVANQSELTKASENSFDIKVDKVKNKNWPDGYYIRTTLISPLFKTVYIGVDGADEPRFRVSLFVTRLGIQLKHNIVIGMPMADLLRILDPLSPEKANTLKESYDIGDDGGVMLVRFVADKGHLGSVEFYTSDKNY